MRRILLCILTILASLIFSGCAGGQTALPNAGQTEAPKGLPKEMPQGMKVTYISDGGMLPSFFQIVISGKTMKVTRRSQETGQKDVVKDATLSDDELKGLYRAFVENRFETIKPNEKIEVADGKSRSLELRFGQSRFYAITGDGIETTQTDGERFNNIEKALGVLVKKYAGAD